MLRGGAELVANGAGEVELAELVVSGSGVVSVNLRRATVNTGGITIAHWRWRTIEVAAR